MNKQEVTLNHGERKESGWTLGTAALDGVAYDFQVKHFDEPSVYGIRRGRISKLWLRRQGEDKAVLSYDRGWERGCSPRGKDEAVTVIYKTLIAKFN